jgi:hypothetical protein
LAAAPEEPDRFALTPAGLAALAVERRYRVLFVTLLAVLVVQASSVYHGAGLFISDTVITIGMIAVFLVVFARERVQRIFTLVAGLATLAAQWGHHVLGPSLHRELTLAYHALIIVFLSTAVWVILRDLFVRRGSGYSHIFGAMSGYMIVAGAFANAHILAYMLAPASMSVAPELEKHLADRHSMAATFLYYSFTQLLTIGYSDITALAAPATTLSLLEALFGVFYLAVIVSQLMEKR